MYTDETFNQNQYLKWTALAVVLIVAGTIYVATGNSEIPLLTHLINGFSGVDAGVLHGAPVRMAGAIMVAGGYSIMRSSWLRHQDYKDDQDVE